MEKEYERHTNGTSVSSITLDSSAVFDKVTIDFGFIWTPFKRFTVEVKYQDMGNHTGADFSNLKLLEEKIKTKSCGSFKITPLQGMGMLFHFSSEKVFVPIYDYIQDYYKNDIDLVITYTEFNQDGTVRKCEVQEYNPAKII